MRSSKISHWRAWSYVPCWMPGWTWLSLSLQRVPSFVRNFFILLGTGCCASAEKPSSPRLDHPSVPAKPPVWHHGNGRHWRFLFMSIINTVKASRILGTSVIAWKEESALWRLSLLPTLTHIRRLVWQGTCLQSWRKISVYRSPKPDIRTFPMLVPLQVKEVMISEDGPFTQTEVPAPRMVKPSQGGVSLHDHPMEELRSCLVLSSPPRPILLSQVPELIPTTLLRCVLWLRHCLSLVLVARLPVMWTRVCMMTLNMLLVCARARSKPALMFSWR